MAKTENSLHSNAQGNHGIMEQARINQLHIEMNTWRRFLSFFRDENVCLKDRLSDVLKNGFDRTLLDELENFQTKFIKEDEMIHLLRNEITELDGLLSNENGDGISDQVIGSKVNNLRGRIIDFEKQFCQLQVGFNTYLFENIK